jgi:membrane protein DedA with SNARE-associated domain
MRAMEAAEHRQTGLSVLLAGLAVPVDDPLGGLAGWIIEVVYALGYGGVFVLVLLENLVPPIPSEVVLPLAGFLVGQGRLGFAGVMAAATAGSVGGALILYGLGYWLGEARLRRLARRLERLPLIEEKRVDQAQDWFRQHGAKAVFIGRLVPTVRSVISIPAGLARMPLGRFVLYTALGSGLWNGLLIGLGWWLGAQWEQAAGYAELAGYVVVVLLVAAAAWWLIRRYAGQPR